jgi:sugar phosphate isomerase/epimerase
MVTRIYIGDYYWREGRTTILFWSPSQEPAIAMKYGTVLHGANLMEAPHALRELAEVGFAFFEYSDGHVRRMEAAGKGAFQAAVETASSLQLKPIQLHGPSMEPGFDLASPDEKARRWSVKRSCRWIEHCVELGVPVMVEHGCEFHQDFRATMDLTRKSFSQIGPWARDHGVRVAIENEFDPRPLVRRGKDRCMEVPARVGCMMSELLEVVELEPDGLGVCLDFGHANLQRPLFGIDEAIRELGEHLIATHLHDNEGQVDQHMLPLQGNLDWNAALAALKEIGYPRPLILEVGGASVPDAGTRMNRLRLLKMVAEGLLAGG